ncbi:MAG TPA: AMP-binding protein [Anaeromyxobacteraceae bacterium]|nr:AMP-binding protein [Anaeromyxobacteraceae bacterium]
MSLPDYRSIADIPFRQARLDGRRTAIVHSGGALSFADLDQQSRRFASFLEASGIGPGERVAVLAPNLPEFAVAYFGAIAAGAVAVPVNTRLAPPEVGYALRDCAAAALVTTPPRLLALAGESLPALRCRVTVRGEAAGAVPFQAALAAPPRPAPAEVDPSDVATLLYTSGTTGFPKGAMITHRNALFNAASCQATLGYRREDVGLLSLPLFHVTGLHSQLVALLAVGGSVVLQEEYDTRQALELASAHRATALFFVPAIYKLFTLRDDLGSFDLSRVRVAAYGGAPMDPETVRAVQRLLPGELHNCYGLTECSSLGTVLPADLALSRSDSVGRAVPGTFAEVRDEAGNGLPPGEAGELWLRGPHVVRGYWGAPEKTAQAIRDGWLRTGDVARIDRDGLVVILDRLKDMINRGGEKIYGLEVENVLYAFPGVAEAAVVGVPHPVFGEVPAAFVAPLPGATLDPEAIRRHCASRLADFKVPVAVRFVEKLPRNPGGKVLKQSLKKAWEAESKERSP